MIYEQFSKYIIKAFLSDDKKGESVSLIIDEQFLKEAAQELKVSADEIINDIRINCFRNYFNYLSMDIIISNVAIQLYAASKCEERGEYTARAYNPRLREILCNSENSLQAWYRNNQIAIWTKLYNWCKINHFYINECKEKSGAGKYPQYPLELAKYTFNREDLKYIASIFHKYKLQPNEEIDYFDFWKIFNIRTDFSHLNNHTKKIFETIAIASRNYDVAKSQIYNHFISWNGEYKDLHSETTRKVTLGPIYDLHLSTKHDKYKVIIKNEEGVKKDELMVGSDFAKWINKYHRYKRDGVIIFQKNKDYPDYWDETRCIEDKGNNGIAVVTNDAYSYKFRTANNLFYDKGIAIYEFEYSNFKEYYSLNEQIYKIVGGLRVGRRTYLVDGEPILQVDKDTIYFKDGKIETITKGLHLLGFSEGEHIIKFPKSPYIKIKTVAPTCENRVWSESFSKWTINVKENKWQPNDVSNGIVGLDFECYSPPQSSQPILKSWTEAQGGKRIETENNISLKLLNNLNKYE